MLDPLRAFTALFLLTTSHAAAGDAESAWKVSANVAVTSDYVFRGISQTMERPAVQAEINLGYRGFYAILLASNVDFNSAADMEVDAYLGWATDWENGFSVDVGAARYVFVGEGESDYTEIYLALGYVDFTATFWYTDDYFGSGGPSAFVEGKYTWRWGQRWSAGLQAGHTTFDDAAETAYTNYRASLGYRFGRFYNLDLAYVDTDLKGEDLADARVVLTFSLTFPGG